MAKAIKLSDELIDDAQRYASVNHRSPPKQIEHWATIGKIAEENPDFTTWFCKRYTSQLRRNGKWYYF